MGKHQRVLRVFKRMRDPSGRERRIRKASKRHGRRADVLKGFCVVCDGVSKVSHHVIPIRFGGSYGKYNQMPVCGQDKKCHSRLNKLSNRWCKRNIPWFKLDADTLLKLTRACRSYLLYSIVSAKDLRIARNLDRILERDAED